MEFVPLLGLIIVPVVWALTFVAAFYVIKLAVKAGVREALADRDASRDRLARLAAPFAESGPTAE
jgi:Na+(H+)/acetate symporter ActP